MNETSPNQNNHSPNGEGLWIAENAGLVKYLIFLSIAVAILIAGYQYYLLNATFYLEYLELVARSASQLLSWMNEPNIIIRNELGGVEGRILGGYDTDVVVDRGAGAVLVMSMVGAAILLWPSSWIKKLAGLLVGLVLILGLNIIRIAASLLIDLYYPLQYVLLVETVLPLLHALIAMVYFMLWAKWTGRHPSD